MPTPRHGLFAAVFDNAIHLAGGATRQGLGPTTTHEVFLVNGGNADYYPCPNFQYTRIVPIVLDVTTGGAHFTTEMTLINTGVSVESPVAGGTPLNLSLHYTASLGDKLGSGTVTDSLAGFEQKVIPNVLSYLRDRGLALPESASAPQQGGVLTITVTGYCEPAI